jgi:hypothetical protein
VADFGVICVAGLVEEGGKSLFNDLSVERVWVYVPEVGLWRKANRIPY